MAFKWVLRTLLQGVTMQDHLDIRLVGNALELGFIELLSECFTLADQAGVGSEKLMELIRDEHKSPALLRYGDRITKNRFDSEGGFNLGGGILDSRLVLIRGGVRKAHV